MKRSAAEKAVENCACVWVKYALTVRDATLAESIQMRNEQAKLREPMALSELHGLRYEPSLSGKESTQRGYTLIREANALCGA